MNRLTKTLLFIILSISCAAAGFSQEHDSNIILLDDVIIFEVDDILIADAQVAEDPVIQPGQVSVFEKSSIEASGARTVADVVDRAPGVVVTRQGGILEPQSVSIRGSAADHVLVLIDGKPAESLWSGGSDLNRIAVQNIERIEVIRGAAAAAYGEGAFSGVINIITEKDAASEVSAELEYGYASFNTHMANAEVTGPISGEAAVSGRLAAGGLYTGGDYSYDTAGTIIERTNNDGWQVNLAGGIGWTPGMAELSISGDFKASERGTPGIMEFLTPDARSEEFNSSAGVLLSTDMDTSGIFNVEAGFSQNYSRYTNPEDNIDDSNSGIGLSCSADWTVSFELFGVIPVFTVSGGYNWDSLDSTALTDSTGSAVDGSADQHSSDLRAAVTLELGQFDIIPAAGFDWSCSNYAGMAPIADAAYSWSAAAGWSPFRDEIEEGPLYLKTNIGTSYKNPSFQDLFWPSGALASGNPDLKAEHGLSWDAGIYLTIPDPALKFEAVGFLGIAEDLIQWMPAAGGIWRPRNLGMVFTGGAELSGYFSMEDLFDSIDMSLSVSYSWLKTVDFDESSVNYLRQLAYRPEHSGRAGLLLSLPEVLSFDFNISYMGYRYTNNSNTKYLESVIVLDAALNYDISENFRISVAAGNFTNVQYIDRLGYPVPGFEWTVKGRVSL